MFSEGVDAFLKFLKLAPRYCIAVAIVCGILLFTPLHILRQVALYDLTQHYRQWLGLAFLISSVLFGVDRGVWVVGVIKNLMLKAKIQKRIIHRLKSLTEEEKQILRFYIINKSKTNTLRIQDGIVKGLEADGVIFRSANYGSMLEGWSFNITDFAWDYLQKDQSLLAGSTNTYRTDAYPPDDKLMW